ncbi:MAG: hypothetical protein ACKPKO_05675, partial [Candidatus Fonsibacter sp.]
IGTIWQSLKADNKELVQGSASSVQASVDDQRHNHIIIYMSPCSVDDQRHQHYHHYHHVRQPGLGHTREREQPVVRNR